MSICTDATIFLEEPPTQVVSAATESKDIDMELEMHHVEEGTKKLCLNSESEDEEDDQEKGILMESGQDDFVQVLFRSQVKTIKSLSDNQGVLIEILDRIKALEENREPGAPKMPSEPRPIDCSKEAGPADQPRSFPADSLLSDGNPSFLNDEMFSSCSSEPSMLSTYDDFSSSVGTSDESTKKVNSLESSDAPGKSEGDPLTSEASSDLDPSVMVEKVKRALAEANKNMASNFPNNNSPAVSVANDTELSSRLEEHNHFFAKFDEGLEQFHKEQESRALKIAAEAEERARILQQDARMRMADAHLRVMDLA